MSARSRAARAASVGVLLFAALVLRLRNAWTDLDALSLTTLPDDAFYYFGIAKNVALGNPPSIDGVNPTNGYHPLWLFAVLVPIYSLTPPDDLRSPIHAAMTVGAVLDVFAAFVLYRILKALRVAFVPRLCVLALYAFNPFAVALATSGLETPLALALGLSVTLAFLTRTPFAVWDRRPRMNPLVFGALGGLAVLARTDATLLVGTLVFTGLYAAWRAHGRPRTPAQLVSHPALRASVRFYLIALGATVLVVCPWLAYSWLTTGAFAQSSSLALAVLIDRFPELWGYGEQSLGLRLERLVASVGEGARLVTRFTGIGSPATWAVLLASIAVLVASSGRPHRAVMLRLGRAGPLFVALAILFVGHTFVRRVFREWYSPPFLAGFLVLLALALDHLWRAASHRRLVMGMVALAGAVLVLRETTLWQTEGIFAPVQYSNFAPNPRVHEGHTDCGVLGYFRGGVTNLDGVVNQRALEALRAGRLLEYVQTQRFEVVYATDHYHSSVFFGARYRERIRRHPQDPRGVVPVTARAKNLLIRIGVEPVSLGSAKGWELLSEGWMWETHPEPERAPFSLGPSSEVIFVPEEPPTPGSSVDLMLSSSLPRPNAVQVVTARVNDGSPTEFSVGVTPSWHSVRAESLRTGRNRLRLEYRNPEAVRNAGLSTWWRTLTGNPFTAVRAHRIRLTRTLPLPPEGPALENATSDAWFVRGWLQVERPASAPAGVWAVAIEAQLRFRWNHEPRPARLTIAAGPPPPSPDGSSQTVVVTLNGHRVGTFELRPSLIEAHEVAIAETALRRGENQLEMSFSRLAPPDEQGVARASYVRSISLE